MYTTESSKWKAYQFSDPFAAGSFIVCNKINKTFCRPDCDYKPTTNLKSEIKFLTSSQDAMNYGYLPCQHCDPINPPLIDVNLLTKCVESINNSIGFVPPLINESDDLNNKKIKESIQLSDHGAVAANRRCSVPAISNDGKYSKDFSLTKNDSDHYKLVDLACRHLSLAAALNIFQLDHIKSPSTSSSTSLSTTSNSNSSSISGSIKKRRRRGGVLGFKELAAKSKLSAWHFHRVFKSVTGLTPKTYGDRCWEFIKSYKNENGSPQVSKSQSQAAQSGTTNTSPILESSNTFKNNFRFRSDFNVDDFDSTANELSDIKNEGDDVDPLNISDLSSSLAMANKNPIKKANKVVKKESSSKLNKIRDNHYKIYQDSEYINSQLNKIISNKNSHHRAFSAPEININLDSIMTSSLFNKDQSSNAQQQAQLKRSSSNTNSPQQLSLNFTPQFSDQSANMSNLQLQNINQLPSQAAATVKTDLVSTHKLSLENSMNELDDINLNLNLNINNMNILESLTSNPSSYDQSQNHSTKELMTSPLQTSIIKEDEVCSPLGDLMATTATNMMMLDTDFSNPSSTSNFAGSSTAPSYSDASSLFDGLDTFDSSSNYAPQGYTSSSNTAANTITSDATYGAGGNHDFLNNNSYESALNFDDVDAMLFDNNNMSNYGNSNPNGNGDDSFVFSHNFNGNDLLLSSNN